MVLGSVLEPAWIHSQAVQVCHKYRQVVMCFADEIHFLLLLLLLF